VKLHFSTCMKHLGLWMFSFFILSTSCAHAAAESVADEVPRGLATLDWIIIAIYAVSTIGLGYYYGRKQTTTKEYFVGSGEMPWFLIGVSLFATLLSTITYLSIPGEMVGKGPIYLTSLLALPLVYPVVAYWMLPLYMKHKVTSAYELLEIRLGLSIRMLGATMFLLLRLVWMSLLVYLAAKAMAVMMGVDADYIPYIVLVTGFVSVVYTSLGGLRAVVVTDFIQSILLFGGALLVIAMVTIDAGGFGWFPTQFQEHWDSQPIITLDPKVRVSVFGTILSVFCWYVFTSGGDQVSVQRFMSTRDLKAARRALMTQLMVAAFITLTLGVVGFALMGYFQAHPEFLPTEFSFENNADDVYPRFISFHLPMGISGVVVAAMFAAAMSSIDSGVNSITAVVMSDFCERFGYKPKTDKGHMFMARCLAFGIGAVVVFGSMYVGQIEGNITAVTGKTANLLVTPIFCLFFFALFVPNARTITVWIGWFFGFATAIMIGFSGYLFGYDAVTGYDPVSFQWIAPTSFIVNVVVGLIAHTLLSGKEPVDQEA
jgi:solute:Na+ symporter, SSS family